MLLPTQVSSSLTRVTCYEYEKQRQWNSSEKQAITSHVSEQIT